MTGGAAFALLTMATTFFGSPEGPVERASDAGLSRYVDGVAVRFFAPELGGVEKPRFLSARMVSFLGRLERMGNEGAAFSAALDERHVRVSVDRYVAEEILSSLPHERPPSESYVQEARETLTWAFEQRVGGRDALNGAARLEGISPSELREHFFRLTLAAVYLDRSSAPFLRPTEDQLREAFRTAGHPYRGASFERVRTELARWLVLERFRVAELAFFQAVRGRVTLVYEAR